VIGKWPCRNIVPSSQLLPFCDREVSEEFSNEVFGSSEFDVDLLLSFSLRLLMLMLSGCCCS